MHFSKSQNIVSLLSYGRKYTFHSRPDMFLKTTKTSKKNTYIVGDYYTIYGMKVPIPTWQVVRVEFFLVNVFNTRAA
jgi:hypothetical protein